MTVIETVRREPSDAPRRRPDLRGLVAGVSRGMDGLGNFAVLGFAAWTLLYHVGLIFDLPTDPLLITWIASLVGVAWYLLMQSRGRRTTSAASPAGLHFPPVLIILAIGLAIGSGIVLGFGGTGLWWTGWALAAGAAILGIMAAIGTRAPVAMPAGSAAPAVGTVIALVTSIGFAILSLFTMRGSSDDTFYVNRAAWVADHGTIPVHDTMFTDQRLPAIRGAGVPVASIETLNGAIAHVLHLYGASVTYLGTPPVATFIAMWSLWRLVRSWGRRRLALCYAVAVVAWAWSSNSSAELGVYVFTRMQQGKVIFLAMLIPLVYLYLTNWVRRPDRHNAVLLAASGVAAVGLTSSATFLMPLICATTVAPLLLKGALRVAAGAALPTVYPVVVGIVVHFTYSAIDPNGRSYTPEAAMQYVFGIGGLAFIGWTAVFTATWLARDAAARLVTAGIAAVLVVILAPGILSVMNGATDAHAVLWRTMWVAPIPVVVGLVAGVPVPSKVRWTGPVAAVGVCVALILVGLPFWADRNKIVFTSGWRYPADELQRAHQIASRPLGGPVLAPPATMRAVDIMTTRVHAVSPQLGYVHLLIEPQDQHQARILLATVIRGDLRNPTPTELRAALDTLHVSLVCGLDPMTHRKDLFTEAGYVPAAGIAGGWCLSRPT